MGKIGLTQCPIYKEKGDYFETSPFGYRFHPVTGEWSGHTGTDGVRGNHQIATIVAIEDGVVIDCCKTIPGYDEVHPNGNYIRLQHTSGRHTWYLHLAYNTIPDTIYIGAKVKKGQTLGMMGDTGRSTGSHIHFQVHDIDGKTPVDPIPFLLGEKKINYKEEYDAMCIIVTECKYKDTGDAVRRLQAKICQLSKDYELEITTHSTTASGELDGIFGQGMVTTLTKIQEEAGIIPTGECDAQTCELLNSSIIELAAKINTIRDIID